jgi:hypothetical protein
MVCSNGGKWLFTLHSITNYRLLTLTSPLTSLSGVGKSHQQPIAEKTNHTERSLTSVNHGNWCPTTFYPPIVID